MPKIRMCTSTAIDGLARSTSNPMSTKSALKFMMNARMNFVLIAYRDCYQTHAIINSPNSLVEPVTWTSNAG
jgi:hypothetical protein